MESASKYPLAFSGTPCTSRLKTAVTALLQKLQDRRDKSAALILAASREAEETAFTLASRMSEGTGLRIAATTGVRDGAGLAAIFATAPDLVVTNPKVLKKVFDKGFVAPEAFRTILVDGAEVRLEFWPLASIVLEPDVDTTPEPAAGRLPPMLPAMG